MLYKTNPHPCSYLEGMEASTIFVDPNRRITTHLYTELTNVGFRRSGNHLYRPQCENCQACIAARIPVQEFKPSRQQRKTWNRNQDVVVGQIDDIGSDPCYQLYKHYIEVRHWQGDMYPPSREQYDGFLGDSFASANNYGFWLDDRLIGVAVTDRMETGLSAIYTFYDPDYQRRSLGVMSILWQIQHTKEMGLPYLYLGYWIKNCDKMRYKSNYRPLQLLIDQRWLTLR